MIPGGNSRAADPPPPQVHFFVSYTGADEAWAIWVAEVLEGAGQHVALQAWDSPAGRNFVTWISEQMEAAGCTIAICSPAYFDSHWCALEWAGALARNTLLPLRVADCPLPPVLSTTIGYRDLHGLDEDGARRRLLEATGLAPTRRTSAGFPGTPSAGEVPFPGRLPTVFRVPLLRLRYFTGRQSLLDQIRATLADSTPVAVTALHGLGGVGKTQLALEYVYRHAAAYELIWWVDAEQDALVGAQLAALAPRLGLPVIGRIPDDAATVLDALRHRQGWLLVFDNAESPAALLPWLPGGAGQVLITSRSPGWGGLASRVDVDVLTRAEAVALLGRRTPGIDPAVANALGDELGDLPLALEQAAAYLETTALPPSEYLEKFRTRRAHMLGRGRDLAHGGNLDTVWSLALDRLRTLAPAAVQLLDLCAHLGPEPIPLALIRDHPGLLGPPLREATAGTDPADDLDDTVGAVLAYSLARRAGDTVRLHRLVATVIRAHQPPARHAAAAATVRGLLVAHRPPGDHRDPAGWPRWAALTPQVLTAPALHPDDPAADIGADARRLLLTTTEYLFARGDFRAAGVLGRTLQTRWGATLGPDHPHSLTAARAVAMAHHIGGDYHAACVLDREVYARCRRLYGDDHFQTLATATNLANDLHALGEHQAARTLNEDTLVRRRRVLGDDHRDTLTSASNLAACLRELGENQAARKLDEDTFTRRRRVLGDDDPDTLTSANNLAYDLTNLGEHQAARDLDEDALARYRRVLGDDHPHTLRAANNLAEDLHELGEHQAARALDEDTLARRRRIFGDGHRDTLTSANNLARDLHALGEHQAAREWDAFVARHRRRS